MQPTILRFILFFLIFNIISPDYIKGQNTAIELSKGNKIKYLKPGRIIKIYINGEKYKGKTDSITPDKVFINGTGFSVNEIDKISVRYRGTMIAGSITGTAGVAFGGLGAALIISGYDSNDLGGAVMVALGIFSEIIAIPAIIAGSSIFFAGKQYKKSKGWTFKTVQLE